MGFQFSNADEVLRDIVEKIRAAAVKGMTNACFIVEDDSKRGCPHNTGMLRQSISSLVEEEDGKIVGYVGSNLDYAPYVHQGTGIYAVEGNGRKEVPWHYKDIHGKWHSTKGIKPTPFIYDAIEKNRSEIINVL
jgi:HK97 gp10 family phage protein